MADYAKAIGFAGVLAWLVAVPLRRRPPGAAARRRSPGHSPTRVGTSPPARARTSVQLTSTTSPVS